MSKPTDITSLKQQNDKLKIELDGWKKKLVDVGISHGIRALSATAASTAVNKQTAADVTFDEVQDKKKEVKKAQPKKNAGMIL